MEGGWEQVSDFVKLMPKLRNCIRALSYAVVLGGGNSDFPICYLINCIKVLSFVVVYVCKTCGGGGSS